MHIRVMLLEPLLALLRRAAELAVLGLAHQPVVFSGRFEPTERGTQVPLGEGSILKNTLALIDGSRRAREWVGVPPQ